MERILHELIQGSPEWHQFRLDHDGASEAAAMIGLSKTTTRTELLRAKSTGIAKEFSDFVQTRILDKGHEVEALARPIAEKLIGDDLYPATYSLGRLSASCDGLTMDDVTAFEHKQWNAALAASVERGELPEEHMPQCQQVLLVTGAQQLLFMVSDGTEENMESMYVRPDQKWFARIRAGWAQFERDLAEFKPVEVLPPVTAAPVMALPALSIQVRGEISLVDNLKVFGEELTAFIGRIPEKPETDQQFADCKAACKALQDAQDALDAAEAHALGQISSFDEMKRTKAALFDLARSTRLAVEKLVAAREQQIKVEIRQAANDAFALHVANLNTRIGKPYLSLPIPDFAGAMKGKRTIASLHDACDTLMASSKIAANEIADKIQINMNTLRELAADYKFLFADTAQLVLKNNDDLVNLIKLRITEHQAAEAKRLEAEREKIRAEESARAESEARVKVEAKAAQDRAEQAIEDRRIAQALADEEARLQGERAEAAKRQQVEDDRLAEVQARQDAERRAVEAERQKALDINDAIQALRERITGIKEYAGIAKAIDAWAAKAEKRAA